MNKEELKSNWDKIHNRGLAAFDDQQLSQIISQQTTEVVSRINRKLFRAMLITGLATLISAFVVVLFYVVYDPIKHPWIDASKLVPVQLLGFVIFAILYLFGWLEYKLVNRDFPPDSVKYYVSTTLSQLNHYRSRFTLIILLLLLGTFYIELNYFIVDNDLAWVMTKVGVSALLTAISYITLKIYYQDTFGNYLDTLSSYQQELGEV